MVTKKAAMRWGVEKRMEFIEFRLLWDGGINRADIVQQFGISPPQASNDLTQYKEVAPKNIIYDLSEKKYHAAENFNPLFLDADPDQYLSQLKLVVDKIITPEEAWIAQLPNIDSVPVPHRSVNLLIMKALVDAIRNNRSLNIHYQSMGPKNKDPSWRWISPHGFANDGARWHVRAFCHKDSKFKDFHISRILGVGEYSDPQAHAKQDATWNALFEVILVPNPKISKAQQKATTVEYGMRKGRLTVKVRQALLFYFKKSLRIDVAEKFDDPYEAPLVIENRKEFETALAAS
jgi:hypothetical protein